RHATAGAVQAQTLSKSAAGSSAQQLERARYQAQACSADLGVVLGALDGLVAEQCLDGADVSTSVEQMRGVAVPQGVWGNRLGNSRILATFLQGMLDCIAAERLPIALSRKQAWCLGALSTVVPSQRLEQATTQRHQPRVSLTVGDADQHSLAVDIVNA